MNNHVNATMAECLSPFAPPPARRSLNDDDLYVIDLDTLSVLQEYGSSSASAQAARIGGIPIKPGQALVRGMQARSLGVS